METLETAIQELQSDNQLIELSSQDDMFYFLGGGGGKWLIGF